MTSRQRDWQRKQQSKGLCIKCGKTPINLSVKNPLCQFHFNQNKKRYEKSIGRKPRPYIRKEKLDKMISHPVQ